MAQDERPAGDDAEGAPSSRSRRRTGIIIAVAVPATIVAIYLLAVLTTAGGIPSNTVVADVEIGGLSQQEAAAKLETELADTAAAPITATALESETTFVPGEIGMAPDYAATAEVASGPIFNPVRLFKHITGQTVEVAAVVNYDEDLLQEGLTRFAASADQPAVEPLIEMDPTAPTLEPGADGQGIDQPAAEDLIVSSYLITTDPIELPVTALPPAVSQEEAQRVLEEYAVPAVSGPVKVAFDSSSESLSVDTIAEGLSFSAVGSTLEPQLNVEVVRAGLPALAEAEDPGTDATWNVSSGTPVVVPSKQGRRVTDEELSTKILGVLPDASPAARTVVLEIVLSDPALTTEQAQALNITEKLSSFTQKFDYARYREVNVGQAAKYMNGKVLKPGDVYSMNGTIRERTEANGYVAGTFISNGRFEEGLGGGVSIATTATWTAAFFAGLEAVEVNPHSIYISRYQPGLEATVAWGQLDLRFANDTGNGVLITTESGGTFITVTMWGTKKYDRIYDVSSERRNITPYATKYDTSAGCTSQGGVNGFTIDVYRVFEKAGREVSREKFTTRYDPTTRYVCGPPPAESPSPSPSQTSG